MSSFRQARAVKGVLHRCLVCHDWFATTTQFNEATEFTQALRVHFDYIRRRVIDEVVKFEWLLAEATKILACLKILALISRTLRRTSVLHRKQNMFLSHPLQVWLPPHRNSSFGMQPVQGS